MVLLLLMGLGAASVKAQVRIGGNTAPSAAAVLDLNATDAANLAPGGLVLPRVDLKTNVMQLTSGVGNQTGTMVYDVTTTLGRIGVYYWNGNSWVLASLPSATAVDSGKILTMTSTGPAWLSPTPFDAATSGTAGASSPVTWSYYEVSLNKPPTTASTRLTISVPFSSQMDICFHKLGWNYGFFVTYPGAITYIGLRDDPSTGSTTIRCYRPSA